MHAAQRTEAQTGKNCVKTNVANIRDGPSKRRGNSGVLQELALRGLAPSGLRQRNCGEPCMFPRPRHPSNRKLRLTYSPLDGCRSVSADRPLLTHDVACTRRVQSLHAQRALAGRNSLRGSFSTRHLHLMPHDAPHKSERGLPRQARTKERSCTCESPQLQQPLRSGLCVAHGQEHLALIRGLTAGPRRNEPAQ
jgi:hypothetical protein